MRGELVVACTPEQVKRRYDELWACRSHRNAVRRLLILTDEQRSL
jgi:hypothetical protein